MNELNETKEMKATYGDVVALCNKIGNVFNIEHESVLVWIDLVNSAGMPLSLLQERVNELITTWDKATHYGKPSPADLIKGYANDTGTYTNIQAYDIVHAMVVDRIGADSPMLVYTPELHNAVCWRLFTKILENGVPKIDRSGHRLFHLSEIGKNYAKEIHFRCNPMQGYELQGESGVLDWLKDKRFVDVANAIVTGGNLLGDAWKVVAI